MKGQTSMAAIVIAIVLLVFLAFFLFTTTEPAGNAEAKLEYRNLFATNMLLSILNTQTPDCGSFSDMLKAEYFGGGRCGDEAFGERIGIYVKDILLLSGHTDYDWLIVASPNNFVGNKISWGKEELVDENGRACLGCWTAETKLTWGGIMLAVKLYMKTK